MIDRFARFSSSISAIYKYIQKIERDETAKYGLKGPHVQCLLFLARNADGMTAASLCAHCKKDKAAISRAIAELEEKGMLVRKRTYRALLRLTPRGREVAEALDQVAVKAVEQAGNGLSEENRETMYTALDLLASNIQTMSEEGISQDECPK